MLRQVEEADRRPGGLGGHEDPRAGRRGRQAEARRNDRAVLDAAEGMRETAGPAHDLLEQRVRRARRAGTLRRDAGSVDIHELIELFSRRPAGNTLGHERLLAVALDGLRAPGSDALPGPVPDWQAYVRRWSEPLLSPGPSALE